MSNRFYLFIAFVGLSAFVITKDEFGYPLEKGKIKDKSLSEISGLAGSIRNNGCLWAHNDSGNPPELFLLDSAANLIKTFLLNGAHNLDWEDIAIHQETDSISYLYIGDIGDNQGVLPYRTIYKVPEPFADDDAGIDQFEKMIYKYEDGPRDAETIMVDPGSEKIIVISKREKNVQVYSSTFIPFKSPRDTVLLKKQGILGLEGIVGGDISANGRGLLLKDYTHVYYWDLTEKAWDTIFENEPQIVSSYKREPQGEAICWDKNSRGFYTLSEFLLKRSAVLYYYPRQ